MMNIIIYNIWVCKKEAQNSKDPFLGSTLPCYFTPLKENKKGGQLFMYFQHKFLKISLFEEMYFYKVNKIFILRDNA